MVLALINSMKKKLLVGGIALLFSLNLVHAQKGLPAKVPTTVSVNTFYPAHEDFNEKLVSRLKVPAGFDVSAVAEGLGKPRMMAVNNSGGLYVTRRDVGDVLLLQDMDGDGRMESLKTVWSQFLGVHGITIHDGFLYLCSSTDLKRGRINADGSLSDTTSSVSYTHLTLPTIYSV